mmetsp:Transcript_18367/g.33659  ORF Transcript_18367/g.33659 Transcript_18367/m.33659 type:complete len:358 (+) Transcript_18367:58-1131(+)
MTNQQPTITISFQPIKIKLFRSKKKSLLVIDGSCVNGSLHRIRPGNKALVHVRPSSSLSTLDDIECLAKALLIDNEEIRSRLNKGCWIDCISTKQVVIKAHANMERNRRGDRLVECTVLLAVLEQDDDRYLPTNRNNEYNEFIMEESSDRIFNNPINLKTERHKIFAHWLIETYGKERLSQGSGVIDVAGGNGMISRTLTDMGIRSTLLDPNPRYDTQNHCEGKNTNGDEHTTNRPPPFGVIPHPLNGDGTDLTSRDDDIGTIINNCSFLCGLHPDQATEPIVTLALRLNVPFAIVPCCVMPSLFPNRLQRRYNNDPVRSYSAFCQYLLDMASDEEEFEVGYLPFVGRNKVIYSGMI